MKAKQIHLTLFSAFVILSVGVGTVCAQSTVFTYQGRVLDNGTNFNGAGQFKFALVASTNANHTATATANAPSGGFITGYNVTFVGNGYVTAPAVTVFGGGGSGAAATAHLTGDTVTSISVANTGDGNYTSAPTVLIAPPPPNISYTSYWSNDGTSTNGSEPTSAVSVNVANGLFTVVLGDTTIANMAGINASLFSQQNLQLRIWFNDGVNGSTALSPLQNLTPSPYAVFADTASNAVTATTASTLSGAVPVTQLSGTIQNAQLANNSITVNPGIGLSGGGVVALGGSTTLNNNGVLSVSGNADITASTTSGAVTLGSTATDAAVANAIVKRDGSGNFSADTITLSGTLSIVNSGHNTAVGQLALGENTTGVNNAAFGFNAFSFNTSGNGNAADGAYALNLNSVGTANTAIGSSALANCTNGTNNIALGSGAGANINTGNNNIYIGNPGTPGDNGTIRVGYGIYQTSAYINGIYNTTVSGTTVQVNSGGQLGVASSSRKFKQDIQTMADMSDELLSLRPVTFKYKPEIEPQGLRQFGLIAEEVEQVDPNLVVHDKEHGIYTVRYDAVNAMLLNEFLKEHKTVQAQNTEIQDLKQSVAQLKAMVEKLAVK